MLVTITPEGVVLTQEDGPHAGAMFGPYDAKALVSCLDQGRLQLETSGQPYSFKPVSYIDDSEVESGEERIRMALKLSSIKQQD